MTKNVFNDSINILNALSINRSASRKNKAIYISK